METNIGIKTEHKHRNNNLLVEILTDGTQEWYKNGEIHRDNDLPTVIFLNEHQFWYKNGKKT